MTREEHIENLKAIASDMPSDKCADWIESLMAGVKALEQVSSSEKPNKWIPVEIALPEVGIDVLICDLEGTIYLSHRSSFDIYFDEWGNKIKGVRAWMPLPPAWEGEK